MVNLGSYIDALHAEMPKGQNGCTVSTLSAFLRRKQEETARSNKAISMSFPFSLLSGLLLFMSQQRDASAIFPVAQRTSRQLAHLTRHIAMGNAQSDEGEAEAYRIIKYIPGVNIGYSAARACVYQGRADNEVRGKLPVP